MVSKRDVLVVFMLVSVMLSACGEKMDSTPTPQSTPTPATIAGTIPTGWSAFRVPGTEVDFALPDKWLLIDVAPGTVSFGAEVRNQDSGIGAITFVEEIPASKLSLLRIMDASDSLCAVLNQTPVLGTKIVDEGALDDPPLYWAAFAIQDETNPSCWHGGIITPRGTIIISLAGGRREDFEQIARTISYPAPAMISGE